jgi:hypothetical protein
LYVSDDALTIELALIWNDFDASDWPDDSCLPLRVCVTVVEWADDLAEYTGSKPSDFDLSWLIGARRQRRLP